MEIMMPHTCPKHVLHTWVICIVLLSLTHPISYHFSTFSILLSSSLSVSLSLPTSLLTSSSVQPLSPLHSLSFFLSVMYSAGLWLPN